jgi:hypothetical protein
MSNAEEGAMQVKTVWQFNSSNPENADSLATIRQWWAQLNGKEIFWQQRVLPANAEASELNWEPQRFDEKFVLIHPEVRGITLYWQKPDAPQEKGTTPHKLVLDSLHQQLYIFPQSQKELVMRVGLPEVVYQKIAFQASQWQYNASTQTLTVRDDLQKLEIQIAVTPESLANLKQQL